MPLIQVAISAVLFIAILAILVLIHEVGHFVLARRAGVRVHEFGVGFPPRAKVLRNDGETLYTLNWLPIGGFVKLEGEDGDSDDPRSFTRAPFLVKQAILVAGVVMNLILALAIMVTVAWLPQQILGIGIGYVDPTSPAAEVGLVPGDVLYSLDGEVYDQFDAGRLLEDLRASAGETVTIGIQHADGEQEELTVTLRTPEEIAPDKGALGVGDFTAVLLDETFTRTPVEAIATGVERTVDAFGLIINGLAALIGSIASEPTQPPPVTGPIGIFEQVNLVFWQAGIVPTLYLAGLLSANLALVNILPFPPLDGGRMLMLAIKAAVGTRLSVRVEQLTYMVGFVFLFGFLIYVTLFDILRIGGVGQ
jgi:regulator of sigma E protease